MPLFSYIAIDKEGKQKEGTLEVGSQNEAISRIKEMGFYPHLFGTWPPPLMLVCR